MPEAIDEPTTPAPRIVRVVAPIEVTLHQPGKTRRAPLRVITGRLVAKAYQGSTLHHYRVHGDDGVMYLAPPDWLVGSRLSDIDVRKRSRMLHRLAREWSMEIVVLGPVAEAGA